MSANPLDVIIVAAIETAAAYARTGVTVSHSHGESAAEPFVVRANEIIDAVKQVRP